MPCNSSTVTSVEFAHVNLTRLHAAMRDGNWGASLNTNTVYAYKEGITMVVTAGRSTAEVTTNQYAAQSAETVVSEAKQLYAKRTVKDLTKKFGWILKAEKGNRLTFGKGSRPGENDFTVEVLPSGSVKILTGKFAGAAHAAADKLMGAIQSGLGGTTSRERTTQHEHHDHNHDHVHTGRGHDHE